MFQLEITILAWAALLAAGANSNQLKATQGTKACLKLLNDFSIGPSNDVEAYSTE